jgi:hypothetical protein
MLHSIIKYRATCGISFGSSVIRNYEVIPKEGEQYKEAMDLFSFLNYASLKLYKQDKRIPAM